MAKRFTSIAFTIVPKTESIPDGRFIIQKGYSGHFSKIAFLANHFNLHAVYQLSSNLPTVNHLTSSMPCTTWYASTVTTKSAQSAELKKDSKSGCLSKRIATFRLMARLLYLRVAQYKRLVGLSKKNKSKSQLQTR